MKREIFDFTVGKSKKFIACSRIKFNKNFPRALLQVEPYNIADYHLGIKAQLCDNLSKATSFVMFHNSITYIK